MEAQVIEAEKHLMFAMYLNWKQSLLIDRKDATDSFSKKEIANSTNNENE